MSRLRHDIALIHLKNDVTLNTFIQPACLWDINNDPIHNLNNQSGVVIGWGFTQVDKQSDVLQQAEMPIVPSTICLESNPNAFSVLLGQHNYCAGSQNG